MPSQQKAKPVNAEHAVSQIRKDIFISLLALASVAIGLHDIVRPRANADFTPLDFLDLTIVAIFIVDFVVSARAGGDWRQYVRRHWYEVPSLIPVTGNLVKGAETVALLRGLRLIRMVRVLRLLRIIGAAARLRKFWVAAVRIALRAHLPGLALAAFLIVMICAGLGWLFEAPTNEAFRGGHSVWWAVNMISNVAYVDFQPKTLGGRIVAGILEFTGIGFIGLFTASLASAMVTDKDEPTAQTPPLD